MQRDYKLADGSRSSEYKIGDRFEVVYENCFSKGSVVEFFEDDGSSIPRFKLISGYTEFSCAVGVAGAYEWWGWMKPLGSAFIYVPEEPSETALDEESLRDRVAYHEALLDFLDDNLPNLEELVTLFEEEYGG